jgi:molybdopterin converting factor small subunit
VDSARFNDALAALRGMAVDVKSESTSGQDVTEQYTDLDAQLRNLQASETQLLKLMDQAGKVADVLAVQQELVKTRGQIEQIMGRMQYLKQSSTLAFIQVTLEQSKLAVDFTATARSIKAGDTVYFVPTVSGGFTPYSYAWDFGDGRTATEERPSHAYKSDGTYTVTLKVTDDRGNTANITRDKYVTVLPGWSAGNTAGSARNGLVAFGHFLVDLLIWVGYLSPLWVVTLVVVLYFSWWRPRKKKKS